MGHVGLIIKATRLCNLRCSYCHDWATGPGRTMRFAVLAAMVRGVLAEPSSESVDFIWHGGETTLLPIDFYRKAVLLQQRFRRPGQRVRNVIQTNGTLLDDRWARFLREYGFRVGVSLDGPPEIHDRHRLHRSGRASFADVARGIGVLRAYEIPFTALMVVGDEALAAGPDRVFDTFLDLGIPSYSLISVKPDNDPGAAPGTAVRGYLDPPRMTRFLSRLYDRWQEHGDDRIAIRELRAIENRVHGRAPGICTLAGDCLGRYFLVEPSGEVAHCDLFLGDARYTLGSLLRTPFGELANGARMAQLRAENDTALATMRQCPEFSVCNGWCPHERYLSVRHNPAHRDDCCGLRDLIGHVRGRLGTAADPGPALRAGR